MSQGTPQKNRKSTNVDESSRNVGVLYTGYLEKKNPVRGSFTKRFVVLTHEAIHWFARTEGDDLFGEERGRIGLNAVLSVRILEEDGNAFQVESVDQAKRLFRSASPIMCEEWVSAIKSTMKNLPEYQKKKINFANNFRSYLDHDDATPEVTISLISHVAIDKELVLSREPDWDRLIHVKCFKPQDKLLISTSNSGVVTLTSDVLELRSDGAVDFEVAIQGVTLASSLRLTVQKAASAQNAKNSRSSKGGNSTNDKSSTVSKLLALSSDRSRFAPLVLSTMVLLVGASTFQEVTSAWSLFYLFAILHALYTMYLVLGSSKGSGTEGPIGVDYTLRVHAHSFTSPDAPINAPEDEIPQRFINGCEGDMKEARRRWDITRHWREAEGVNTILMEPQPNFFTIKNMIPHYNYGRGKSGQLIYWDRPGDCKFDELFARGLNVDDLFRHWLFVTEYQWNITLENNQTEKTIAVMDIEKVTMSYLAGEAFTFLKRALQAANQHYPERSFAICIINAPVVFSMIWRMVKGMVHPNTQKKVKILSKREVLEGLKELIDISQIPEYYGGEAKCAPPLGETPRADVGLDSCRFYGKETIAINEYVRKLNAQGQATDDPFDITKPSAAPPGVQGALNAKDSGKLGAIVSNHSSIQNLSAGANSNKLPPTTQVSRRPGSVNGDDAPVAKSSGFSFFKRRRGTVTGHADMDHYSVCSETTSVNRS